MASPDSVSVWPPPKRSTFSSSKTDGARVRAMAKASPRRCRVRTATSETSAWQLTLCTPSPNSAATLATKRRLPAPVGPERSSMGMAAFGGARSRVSTCSRSRRRDLKSPAQHRATHPHGRRKTAAGMLADCVATTSSLATAVAALVNHVFRTALSPSLRLLLLPLPPTPSRPLPVLAAKSPVISVMTKLASPQPAVVPASSTCGPGQKATPISSPRRSRWTLTISPAHTIRGTVKKRRSAASAIDVSPASGSEASRARDIRAHVGGCTTRRKQI